MSKEFSKEFSELIEKNVGLPIYIIRHLDTRQTSFYMQNRGKISVTLDRSKLEEGEIYFVLNDYEMRRDYQQRINGYKHPELSPLQNSGTPLSKKHFDAYLDAIGFRGKLKTDKELRLDGIPSSRFLSSKQINKSIDEIF
jgi:hypothetical protein